MSYSNNPPNGKTNAPGDGYCTECHGSGNPGGFDGDITITGLPDTVLSGQTYALTITSSNPNGLAERAGFQLVVLNSSNQNFGTLSSSDPNGTVTPSGGRTYFEHDPSQLFDSNNEASWYFSWKAPAVSGSESFTIYAASNIANNNGDDTGDYIISRTFPRVAINEPDPLNVTVSGTNISCNGQNNGSATANPTGGTAPYSYSWSSGQSTQTISGLAPGNYSVTVTDNASQTTSGAVQITEPDALTLAIDASGTEINCNVTSITLTANVSGGTQGYNYLWSTGAQASGITVTNGGTYTITVTDAKLCTATSSVTITENLNLDVELQPIQPLCENSDPVILEGTPAGGIYSGPGVNGSTFDPSLAGPGNHEIVYTYTEGQCSDFATQIAVVEALPVIEIVPVGDKCLDDPAFNVIATPAGGTFSGPGITSDGIFTPANAGIGTHTITYTINGLCIASGTTQIKVVDCNCPNPVSVNAGEDLSVCAGTIANLNGQGTNASTYVWSSSGDGDFSNKNSLITTYTPGDSDLTNGQVTLTLTGLDPDGNGPCSASSDQLKLTIHALPEITFDTENEVCLDKDSLELKALPDDGLWTGPGVTNNVFHFDSIGIGNYTLNYAVVDNNGCAASKPFVVTVKDCSNIFTGMLSINNTNCKNDSTGSMEVIPGSDATLPISYSWSTGDTTKKIDHLPSGNYAVTATDATGKTLVLQGKINPISSLSILQADTVSCPDASLACPEIHGAAGPVQYLWSTGNTEHCQELIADSTVCLTVSDSLSCKESICIYYNPLNIHVDASQGPGDIGNSGFIHVTISGGNPDYSYTWYRDSIAIATTEDLDSISEAGIYVLKVVDHSGCEVFSEEVVLKGVANKKLDGVISKVYPNPFTHELIYETSDPSSVRKIILVTPFNNYIPLDWNQKNTNLLRINMEQMVPGVYYLIVLENNTVRHFRLLKL
jgi:hypothetical protein